MRAPFQLSEIENVTVVGAGQMGQGIAEVCAAQGYKVWLCDGTLELAQSGHERIRARLEQSVLRGKATAEATAKIVATIEPQAIETAAQRAQLVIEAISEQPLAKLQLFSNLDRWAPANALLCSNTSSISLTKLAAVTSRPELVVGVHFMNPVPVMRLVELVRGLVTSDATHQVAKGFAEKLGKVVVTSRDRPGFIVNRVLIPFLNEACIALEEGVAGVEDLDTAITLGLNHKMGPLRLADWIGLDTVLAIAEVLQRELGDDKYRPAVLLRNLVAAGHLGFKTQRGFYVYAEGKPVSVNPCL
ncbi:MAG TPA: 3-hydroxyacyl-CoA dehydrogenase NAD-binding domain-containing protein [Polyangiaceae bacterium]|jgi:3-hydroxybutyryl-CoA dehydrogenase|nr:3-hydroxyacyl-CoA dehydrogenase NAD-binding domain-containing protein [Polyangiaceae bacterium]